MQRRHLLLLSGMMLAAPRIAHGDGAREILRITGRIAPHFGQGGARFDLASLEALGRTDLVTRTAWTGAEPQRFSGLPLSLLLTAVGAEGPALRGVALNDYAISAPVAEMLRDGAFLATRHDGQPMRVRERGPVWMIFPWSQRPELDVERVRERAIWQLRRIEIT